MEIEQVSYDPAVGWHPSVPGRVAGAQIVLAFGSTSLVRSPDILEEIAQAYPGAFICGCSTAGNIIGTAVLDEILTVTAVKFDATRVRTIVTQLEESAGSFEAGCRLAAELEAPDLKHVLVLSDGLSVNGTALVAGLNAGLADDVGVTGGLAADGERFEETFVLGNDGPARRRVIAIGLYGTGLQVGYGSLGGWDPFGPYRKVTRSQGNVLYELDGKSALSLYKRYLGEHAAQLPASGLLFPLSIRSNESEPGIVRTILGIDEEEQSLTFAGDVPEGSFAQLMKANFDRLIDGAVGAATAATSSVRADKVELALLISCVGRKMVLGQRVEEEVEGVQEIIGDQAVLTGFYSYGEISPFTQSGRCELHNQTMTITTFSEAE